MTKTTVVRINQLCRILVNRGDFRTIREAKVEHKPDFMDILELINQGEPQNAEELFCDAFGLEPDLFEPILFSII